MTIIARVTRTQVSATEEMVGKKVTLLDGTVTKITGVASAYAYAHEANRSRISAYLLVKDGRNFKQIEQEDVDGKVTEVEDAGGYAKYTFAGKRKAPATKPAASAPATKPAASGRKPAPKPAGRKPAASAPAPKPEGRKPAAKPAGKKAGGTKVSRVVERHELPETLATISHDGGLNEANVLALRKEIQSYLAEHYGVGQFEGLAVTSEAHFNSAENNVLITFGLDFTPYLDSTDVIDVNDAADQLIRVGVVSAGRLRSMTDDDILAAYAEYMLGEEDEAPAPKSKKAGGKVKAKQEPVEEFDLDEFEDEEVEEEELEEEVEEEVEEEEREEIAHIALPNPLFSGVVAPKSHEGSRVLTALAEAWDVGTGDIFPGILLQYNKAGVEDPLEVAFIGLTIHKGETAMLVVDTATLDEKKPSRMVVKIEAACSRCLPLVEEETDEEPNELDIDDGEFDLDVE